MVKIDFSINLKQVLAGFVTLTVSLASLAQEFDFKSPFETPSGPFYEQRGLPRGDFRNEIERRNRLRVELEAEAQIQNPWELLENNPPQSFDEAVEQLRLSFARAGKTADIFNVGQKNGWARQCQSFAKENAYGAWGDAIFNNLIQTNYSKFFDAPPDLVAACPDFPLMTPEMKIDVWILVINAMAHFESSCNPTVQATGPNGKLKGLLQLHYGKEEFYSPPCARGDSKTPKDTMDCAIGMLNDQMNRSGKLFDPKSYWDVLRPQAVSKKAYKIYKSITEFPICGYKDPIMGKDFGKKNRLIK